MPEDEPPPRTVQSDVGDPSPPEVLVGTPVTRQDWQAGACSVRSDDAHEPAYGTAARATSWVGLEQNGPWGRQAAVDSRLDPELGAWLNDAVSAVGGRFVLLRSPGAHTEVPDGSVRRVLVASSRPGRAWMLIGLVEDPSRLRGLDLSALQTGDLDAVRRSLPGSAPSEQGQLLVCTNGRRDVCCAVRGRPVARDAAATHPDQVWETSHTGGHRFAPTAVLLPWGQTLARLEGPDAIATLDAARTGRLPAHLLGPRHDRGLSALHPAAQAAVSEVRAALGVTGLADLTTAGDAEADPSAEVSGDPGRGDPLADAHGITDLGGDTWSVVVRHADGRAWRRIVTRVLDGPDHPASCGKPAVPQARYVVSSPAAHRRSGEAEGPGTPVAD